METSSAIQPVNLRAIFRQKNPALARFIPGFVFNIIERIVHQNGINYLIRTYGHKRDLEFIRDVVNDLEVKFVVEGLDKVDKQGRYIFVSNHPLGGFDGLLLMLAVGEKFPEFRFVVNDILMHIRTISGLFVPVNKHGAQGHDNTRRLNELYASDKQVITFPAGLVSRRIKGKITDLPWKNSFIKKATSSGRDIVPVYFSGRNSGLFYGIGSIRKLVGIKANIEMFLLVDELYRHRGKTFTIRFGEPVKHTTFTAGQPVSYWVGEVRRRVYELAR